jgi:hypothetical protein
VTLTPAMRETLQAASQPLRRVHDNTPGAPPWPARWQTLHALTRRGLLERSETRSRQDHRVEVWTRTEAGRKALLPVPRFREEKTVYMA